MAMRINPELCSACGDCESKCPTASIKTRKGMTRINAESCTECKGEFDKPQCVKACPTKGCITQLAA